MARKRRDDWDLNEGDEAEAAPPPDCWLCGRPTGSEVIWHHAIPKSRGGKDTVPMHPICQRTIITHFSNSQLERFGMDVSGLLADETIAKFVAWVAKKEPDFNAPITRKKR